MLCTTNMIMIDEQKQLFPFCVVWTMLPCISWFCPCIGHVGICDSTGVIYDFIGYRVNRKEMSFGRPVKYVRLTDIEDTQLDNALSEANVRWREEAHDLCCNNCHHHVADVLNRCSYRGRADWSQVSIWWMCICDSSYVSKCAIAKAYLPFLITLGVIAGIVILAVMV